MNQERRNNGASRRGERQASDRSEFEFLFDLERDEGERANLAPARPADVARLRAQHEDWFARMTR